MSEEQGILYTVGHSTHTMEHFLDMLKKNKIEALADIRSSPYSKFCPQFNRQILEQSLKTANIHYIFLGNELGARRSEGECYIDNKVSYGLVAKTPLFLEGIRRLEDGTKKMRIAIMCAEKDPLTCHRSVLVAHFGRESFRDIHHILEDGSIETCDQADKRLLVECKMDAEDFFTPYEERLRMAYEKRGSKIGYQGEAEPELRYG